MVICILPHIPGGLVTGNGVGAGVFTGRLLGMGTRVRGGLGVGTGVSTGPLLGLGTRVRGGLVVVGTGTAEVAGGTGEITDGSSDWPAEQQGVPVAHLPAHAHERR